MLSNFLPNVDPLEIPVFCCRYEVVQWWSQCLGKRKYSKHNDQIKRAYWAGENGTIDSSGQSLCTGKIEYFFTKRIVIEDCYKIVPMAKIQWYQEHPVMQSVPAPVEVWSSQFLSHVVQHHLCPLCVFMIAVSAMKLK